MTKTNSLGIFDSGVGGLTIWAEIMARLSPESTLYVADSVNCPYGSRPASEIIAFSKGISRWLLNRQCKLIVVACNTASAAALKALRETFDIPIVGLEPAVKPAALATKSGHIGILATEGTFRGALYQNTSQTYAHNVVIHSHIAPELVTLVESGQLNGPHAEALLARHINPMLTAGVDQLVLGCTHYPFLTPLIEKLVEGRMTVINPAEAVAKQVERLLGRYNLLNDNPAPGTHQFFNTGASDTMQLLLGQLNYPAEVGKLSWREEGDWRLEIRRLGD